MLDEIKQRQERQRRRKVVDDWKEAAKVIKDDAGSNQMKMLRRDARREALTIMEDAARTVEEFERVIVVWDKLEQNEEERIADHESVRPEELLNWRLPEECTIIPPPLEHEWWRQFLNGSFIDIIYDCPHEIHELTSSLPVYGLTKELDENRKEILYYWAIRKWSPQRIATMRKQSDRNIRKVYNKMMDETRYELFYFLYWQYKKRLRITTTQREHVIAGIKKYDDKSEHHWEFNNEDYIHGDADMQYELFYYLYWRYKYRKVEKGKGGKERIKRLFLPSHQKRWVIRNISLYTEGKWKRENLRDKDVDWELNEEDIEYAKRLIEEEKVSASVKKKAKPKKKK